MVIGNGLIASQFYDYHLSSDIVIFASGVSNSSANDQTAFSRERKLLTETIQKFPKRKLVYFSTCSIYDPSLEQSAYVKHKCEMEEIIKVQAKKYLILRLSNPIGRYNNPHTFFNYFIDCISTGRDFEIWANAERNIIDVEDFSNLSKSIIEDEAYTNSVVNIANIHNYKIPEIVLAIEQHYNLKGHFNILNKGNKLSINTSVVGNLYPSLQIKFGPGYIARILTKYFPV